MAKLKKALITGSAVGIGKAIALDLASRNFDVAIHYRSSEEEAEKTCQEALDFGTEAFTLQADVTNPQEARKLVEKAAQGLGGLSVVVNNVGNYLEKITSQVSVEEWQEIINSNLNATFYVTQAALPHLRKAKWGRIINLGFASAQNVLARKNITPYVIAKTGIIIYTKSLAKGIIEENITANVVSPGVVENSIDLNNFIPKLPSKRPASFPELTDAVWFFVNPDACYITGQVLEVSGGWNL